MIAPIKSKNGTLLLSDEEKVEAFNDYFVSVFEDKKVQDASSEVLFKENEHEQLDDIEITVNAVLKKIEKLKIGSAPGPDEIYPRLLKECKYEISLPLALIYQKSINEGRIPEEFKRTNITPIHKKGSKNLPENYRPINVQSVPGKMLESIIKDHIMDQLEKNNLLFNTQYGFRSNHSVDDCLLDYMNEVTKNYDESKPWVTFMSDFQRAFDKVPFKVMLKKVWNHGIRGKLYNWLNDWTQNRKQRVVLNGTASTWQDVISSVIQGSVLGPILFIIFINDLDIHIKSSNPSCKIYKFADDSKLGATVQSTTDQENLQKAIDAMSNWCCENGMKLHPDKCKIMHFGNKNDHKYYLEGKEIEESDCERDLGVQISTDMKYTKHIDSVCKKANGILTQLQRSVTYRNEVYIEIYKTYVRPILESATIVWNPECVGGIKKLEAVQRRALRSVRGYDSISYEERLEKAELCTLQQRRQKFDMIQVYKSLNSSGSELCKISDRHSINTRAHDDEKLVPEKCKTNIRKHFFYNRVTENWNNLPLTIRNAQSLNLFKSQYKEVYNI